MPLHRHTTIRRHLMLRVPVFAMTAALAVASGASAMPMRHGHHHHKAHNPNRVDAASHAATMRAIGAMRMGE